MMIKIVWHARCISAKYSLADLKKLQGAQVAPRGIKGNRESKTVWCAPQDENFFGKQYGSWRRKGEEAKPQSRVLWGSNPGLRVMVTC